MIFRSCRLLGVNRNLDLIAFKLLTNQEVTITIIHGRVDHRAVAQIHMDRYAVSGPRISCPADRVQSLHKVHIGRIFAGQRHIERHPTHLIRIGRQLVPVGGQPFGILECGKRLMNHRRTNAIEPSSGVLSSRCRERGSG